MKQIMHFLANSFPVMGWRIIAVEQEYMLPIGKDPVSGRDIVYPFTVDLVIELAGSIYIVDYKFAADDYSQDRIDIEPQIPGYIGAMRALGIKVVAGFYVFLRTRKMNDIEAQVVTKPCRPNDVRIQQSFKEHLMTTGKIIKVQNDPEWEPTRNAGPNCNYCDFKKVCAIELRGEDASLMKQIDFLPNDYGYEEL
jgi:CRISPR/Cas system-associated exonuclease Cas4 (RecB family)